MPCPPNETHLDMTVRDGTRRGAATSSGAPAPWRPRSSLATAFRASAALTSAVLLAGCASLQTQAPKLNLGEEESAPATVSASELDTAALSRVARIAEDSGGEIIDPVQVHRRIVEREPHAPEPRVELARFLLRRGDLDGAERAFREALTLSSGHLDAQIGLGQVLLARKRPADAAAHFERVAASNPSSAKAMNGWGLALDELRRHREAQAAYRRALQIAPEDRAVRNNLALSLALSGQRNEAVAILRQLADEPGALPRYRENLAYVLSLRGPAAEPRASRL